MKNARVVVFGVALAAGAMAAYLAYSPNAPAPPPPPVVQIELTEVLVAKTEISRGQTVSANNTEWKRWPVESANHTIRKNDQQQWIGSRALVSFAAGEPIRESKLIKGTGAGFMPAMLPAGMQAISIEISPDSAAGGFIQPNDRVNVILTQRDREAEKRKGVEVHTSKTLLTNVKVLAVDQGLEEKVGQHAPTAYKTATLALTTQQSETLALARQVGSVSLTIRSLSDSSDGLPILTPAGVALHFPPEPPQDKVVNVVRFGVGQTIGISRAPSRDERPRPEPGGPKSYDPDIRRADNVPR